MARKRRSFSPSFKAKVALEAIRGVKTIAEIAQKHKLHATQISAVSWESMGVALLRFPAGDRGESSVHATDG